MKADPKQAVRLLKTVIQELSRRHIPATPENYTVWYHYAAATDAELVDYIKRLDERRTAYSEPVNQEIYQRFIEKGGAQQHILEIKNSLRHFVDTLLNTLNSKNSELKDFANTLKIFNQKVEAVQSSNDLQALFIGLMVDTKRQEESAVNLQASLQQMADDINVMRHEMERTSEQAYQDELTKIGNRRMFERELHNAISQSRHKKSPLSMIILDIDHFKLFNDQYGHQVGDKVICYVANILKNSVKKRDKVARIGGEEFAIILPETPYGGAMTLAEQLRNKVSNHQLSSSKDKVRIGKITLSAGIGSLQPDDTRDDLFFRTDKCLYQSKENGRNRITGETELK